MGGVATNFTPPSHGGYEEVDLFCHDAAFAKRVEDAIERDIRDGKPAKSPIRYRRPLRRHRADARFVPRAEEEVEGQREEVRRRGGASRGAPGGRMVGPGGLPWPSPSAPSRCCPHRPPPPGRSSTRFTTTATNASAPLHLAQGALRADAAAAQRRRCRPARRRAVRRRVSTTPTSTRCRSSSARAGRTRRESPASTSTSCRTSTTRRVTRARTACAKSPTSAPKRATCTRSPPAARQSRHLYWQALATLDPATGGVNPDERTLQPEYLPSSARRRSRRPASISSRGAPSTRSRTASRTPTGAWTTPTPATRSRSIFNGSRRFAATWSSRRTATATRRSSTTARTTTRATATASGWATDATTEPLTAPTAPGTAAERQTRLDAFFADWMTYEGGCSIENEYCDNPVQAWLRASGKSMNYDTGGCALAGRARGGIRRAARSARLGLAALTLRRRRRRARIAALLAFALAGLGATAARADDDHRGWRGEARASLSVQNPAYAFGGTRRVRLAALRARRLRRAQPLVRRAPRDDEPGRHQLRRARALPAHAPPGRAPARRRRPRPVRTQPGSARHQRRQRGPLRQRAAAGPRLVLRGPHRADHRRLRPGAPGAAAARLAGAVRAAPGQRRPVLLSRSAPQARCATIVFSGSRDRALRARAASRSAPQARCATIVFSGSRDRALRARAAGRSAPQARCATIVFSGSRDPALRARAASPEKGKRTLGAMRNPEPFPASRRSRAVSGYGWSMWMNMTEVCASEMSPVGATSGAPRTVPVMFAGELVEVPHEAHRRVPELQLRVARGAGHVRRHPGDGDDAIREGARLLDHCDVVDVDVQRRPVRGESPTRSSAACRGWTEPFPMVSEKITKTLSRGAPFPFSPRHEDADGVARLVGRHRAGEQIVRVEVGHLSRARQRHREEKRRRQYQARDRLLSHQEHPFGKVAFQITRIRKTAKRHKWL